MEKLIEKLKELVHELCMRIGNYELSHIKLVTLNREIAEIEQSLASTRGESVEEILENAFKSAPKVGMPIHVYEEDYAGASESYIREDIVLDAIKNASQRSGYERELYPDTEADGYVFCGKCGKMK
jgi:hypothetical protein